jgi:glycosyltransferase involved in cell wall biosynthesis
VVPHVAGAEPGDQTALSFQAEKAPKVSVVLVTYKRAHLLPATIESILAQTFKDFELIICDDCSPDETETVCKQYEKHDDRVRYRRGQKNVGMPGNLNAGIIASSAEYIANLHDGDIYDPKLLEKWLAALEAYPRAAFVFNAYRDLDRHGNTVRIWRAPLGPCVPGSLLLEKIYFRRWRFNSAVWGTVMGRRSAYLDVGLFDLRFGFVSDVDMWMRLAERFDVAYVDEPLIHLASREAAPHLWDKSVDVSIQAHIAQMFWEARVRHFRRRPVRLSLEIARHISFLVADRSVRAAGSLRRSFKRALGRPALNSIS